MIKRNRARLVWLLALTVIILSVLMVLYSAHVIEHSVFEVQINDLPKSFSGYKIVFISDLHGSSFGEDNERLISSVVSAEPDIIVLGGDFVDANASDEHVEEFNLLAGELSEICDVYFISGNHEWASGRMGEVEAILEETGITHLANDYIRLQRGTDSVVLAGVTDPNSYADLTPPDEFIEQVREEVGDSVLLLAGHRNYWPEVYPTLDVDLIMCGHAHGGIVRLPIVGGLLSTDGTLFPEYDAGHYSTAAYELIVSRGLGNSIIIPRFMNAAEIITIILH